MRRRSVLGVTSAALVLALPLPAGTRFANDIEGVVAPAMVFWNGQPLRPDDFPFAVLGDLNGDHVAELAFGIVDSSTLADGNHFTEAGAVVIVSGVDGTPIRTHRGTDSFERLGTAMCAVGDVDGDGVREYVLVARGTMGPERNANVVGSLAVYSGADGRRLRYLIGTDDFRIGQDVRCLSFSNGHLFVLNRPRELDDWRYRVLDSDLGTVSEGRARSMWRSLGDLDGDGLEETARLDPDELVVAAGRDGETIVHAKVASLHPWALPRITVCQGGDLGQSILCLSVPSSRVVSFAAGTWKQIAKVRAWTRGDFSASYPTPDLDGDGIGDLCTNVGFGESRHLAFLSSATLGELSVLPLPVTRSATARSIRIADLDADGEGERLVGTGTLHDQEFAWILIGAHEPPATPDAETK
jgi:hypothetical protein